MSTVLSAPDSHMRQKTLEHSSEGTNILSYKSGGSGFPRSPWRVPVAQGLASISLSSLLGLLSRAFSGVLDRATQKWMVVAGRTGRSWGNPQSWGALAHGVQGWGRNSGNTYQKTFPSPVLYLCGSGNSTWPNKEWFPLNLFHAVPMFLCFTIDILMC